MQTTHQTHVAPARQMTALASTRSVVHDGLAAFFPDIRFVETLDALTELEYDLTEDIGYLPDVDYLGFVDNTGERAFGVQIKPVTAEANRDDGPFGNYSASERMWNSFADFEAEFDGKVFIVFSLAGEIGNPDVIPQIAAEVARLRA